MDPDASQDRIIVGYGVCMCVRITSGDPDVSQDRITVGYGVCVFGFLGVRNHVTSCIHVNYVLVSNQSLWPNG